MDSCVCSERNIFKLYILYQHEKLSLDIQHHMVSEVSRGHILQRRCSEICVICFCNKISQYWAFCIHKSNAYQLTPNKWQCLLIYTRYTSFSSPTTYILRGIKHLANHGGRVTSQIKFQLWCWIYCFNILIYCPSHEITFERFKKEEELRQHGAVNQPYPKTLTICRAHNYIGENRLF